MAKRLSSPYSSRRTDNWVKIKCAQRQEFIIVGYTHPAGSRSSFGALLLAVNDDRGGLRYAGSVGTGFDDRTLTNIMRQLTPLEQSDTPLSFGSPSSRQSIRWVDPKLICEVSFSEWTAGGHVRHATCRGIRSDKPARDISRESSVAASQVAIRSLLTCQRQAQAPGLSAANAWDHSPTQNALLTLRLA